MSQEFHAIYEHGVLRPLTPLNLPELTEVTVILHTNKRPQAATRDPLLGLMADESNLLDEVVEDTMASRESQPFRSKD
jgi:predicted DNA-binding antitoxin AbrB/MazE fold protein